MKNLILLLLAIGAVVNAVELTTFVEPKTVTLPLWTLTHATPTGFDYLSFVLTYNGGTTGAVLPVPADTHFFGVACFVTNSTYAVPFSIARAAFTLNMNGLASGATSTSVNTHWGPLIMTSNPIAQLIAGTPNTLTMGAGSSCPVVVTPSDNFKPVITNFIASWTFTVPNG
jgi:hypothetical protein